MPVVVKRDDRIYGFCVIDWLVCAGTDRARAESRRDPERIGQIEFGKPSAPRSELFARYRNDTRQTVCAVLEVLSPLSVVRSRKRLNRVCRNRRSSTKPIVINSSLCSRMVFLQFFPCPVWYVLPVSALRFKPDSVIDWVPKKNPPFNLTDRPVPIQ